MTTTPPAPTVTIPSDVDPCPRAEVLVSPMPTDAATVTIWRNYAGRRSIVRGANNTAVSGDHLVVDYEAPLQTAVTYTCQTDDVDGNPSQLSAASSSRLIDEIRAWLQDPHDPSSALPIGLARQVASSGAVVFGTGVFGTGTFGVGDSDVLVPAAVLDAATFRKASFAEVTRSADVTVTPVFGSDLPVAGTSVRRDSANVPIEIRTTGDITAKLRDLINQAAFPLLRTGLRVPVMAPLAYIALPDVVERFVWGAELTIWTSIAQSVRGPGADIVIPVRTLDDLGDEAATLDGLIPLYSSLVDLQRG